MKNIARITFYVLTFIILYWLLNKKGYLPPINYFFMREEVADDLQLVSSTDLLNYHLPITKIIDTENERIQIIILIQKSQSRLIIYYQNKPIKSYPVVFGSSPIGDKLREGDMKTPEGIFKIRDLYPHPQWSKFIWLDYPNRQSWQKHLQAKQQGIIPLSASIGSAIGIHGVNQNSDYLIDEKNNWTWGCISLKNQDIEEIYSVVKVGTIVKIVP
jgi:murein L,D-transpeptidase YafK